MFSDSPDRKEITERTSRSVILPRFVAHSFEPAKGFTNIHKPLPLRSTDSRESWPRTATSRNFELIDTGVFEGSRYFDVFIEYAKQTPDDIHIRISAANRGAEPAEIVLLPTLWFRNTWVWGCLHEGCYAQTADLA